jgi:hypothetical protein
MRLTDDGELADLDTLLSEDEAEATTGQSGAQLQPIYCTNCGTANLGDAKYCRSCGKALALQEMKNPPPARKTSASRQEDRAPLPGVKRKNEEYYETAMQPEARSGVAWLAALRFWTMLMLGGVIVTALVINGGASAWVLIPTLIAWFLVEAVRGDGHRNMGFSAFWAEMLTSVMMASASIVAIVLNGGQSAWAIIPIMIAWFLVSAVRSDRTQH